MKTNTKKIKRQKYKELLIVSILFLSMMIGLFSAIFGIIHIENYENPYLFGFIMGALGAIIGILIAIRLKPYLAINRKILNDYRSFSICFSLIFIGVFILAGSKINSTFSTIDNCDKYTVIKMNRDERGFRSPEINSLFVLLNGEPRRLICSHKYWDKTLIGHKIDLCFHKSIFGFDFIILTDDKR